MRTLGEAPVLVMASFDDDALDYRPGDEIEEDDFFGQGAFDAPVELHSEAERAASKQAPPKIHMNTAKLKRITTRGKKQKKKRVVQD